MALRRWRDARAWLGRRSAAFHPLVHGAMLTFCPQTPGRFLNVISPPLMLENRCGELALGSSCFPSPHVLRVLDAGELDPDGAACQAVAAYQAAGVPRQSLDP